MLKYFGTKWSRIQSRHVRLNILAPSDLEFYRRMYVRILWHQVTSARYLTRNLRAPKYYEELILAIKFYNQNNCLRNHVLEKHLLKGTASKNVDHPQAHPQIK